MMSLQHRRDRVYGKKGKGMMSLKKEKERSSKLTGRWERNNKLTGRKGEE
jgi:hypothetical protein